MIGFIIIILTIVTSYIGFKNPVFYNKYKFQVDKILLRKEYKRIITSGFIHANWMHLLLNMLSLNAFYGLLENNLGIPITASIYFISLLAGGFLSLFIHRNHGEYSAIGASGAVSGIIFATIALYPYLDITFFGLPFSIPGWIYGAIYTLISIFGIKSQNSNIGHDAHLGGGVAGMLFVLVLNPTTFASHFMVISLILIPSFVFIFLIITKPNWLLSVSNKQEFNNKNYDIDHLYNEAKVNRQKEIDRILDKISTKGIQSLTAKEKQLLDKYSSN